MKIPVVELPRELSASLRAGHPWIYKDHVPRGFRAPTGSWVRVRSAGFEAYALWDAESPLALRVYSHRRAPDAEWMAERVRQAYAGRAPLRERGDTTAYRLLHGEGDGVPGVVVDLYGPYAVVRLDTPAAGRLLPWIADAVVAAAAADGRPLNGVIRRHRGGDRRVEVCWGEPPPREVTVLESGFEISADLFEGQKTGLFLDHRENRRTIETFSAGKRVLNLFSYTAAFSLYAARGGATQVVSVDLAKAAVEAGARNLERNGFSREQHPGVARDVFEYLEQSSGERFDLVVCDPPSFARNRGQAKRAERAYARVNAAALSLIRDGGLLAAASCTTQVGPEAFRNALAAAGVVAQRRLEIVHEAGQPLDHPVAIGHPEGRYLKFVLVRVGPLP